MDLVLYGALTAQTCKVYSQPEHSRGLIPLKLDLYYLAFPQDRRITKSIVYFVYILGTAQTVFALHDFYTLYCTEPPPPGTYTINFLWFTIPFCGAVGTFWLDYLASYLTRVGMRSCFRRPALLCKSDLHYHKIQGCHNNCNYRKLGSEEY